ncbi:Rha family transcriptional regulator [Xanthobacter variabilis]|uniref:Rha family transcriptional regulator n=1 Tax=Xanthobacter variabilis TaxID=3119932 RepID=UPI00374EA03B
MPTKGATEIHRELRDEGIPNPWRPRRKPLPNPWAGIIGAPDDDPTKIPILVVGADGMGRANSRDVAAYFGKQHKNVLRDIEALLADDPSCRLNFELTSETVAMPRGGFRQEPAYLMDRDGFTLLVMGYSGKKALAFKRAYIKAYNVLEAEAIATREQEVKAQRYVDAIYMAKAAGLYGPDTKEPLHKIIARILDGID